MNPDQPAIETCAVCGRHKPRKDLLLLVKFKVTMPAELSKAGGKFVTVTFKKTMHTALCFVPPEDSPARKEGISIVAFCCSPGCADLLKAEEHTEFEVREFVTNLENN